MADKYKKWLVWQTDIKKEGCPGDLRNKVAACRNLVLSVPCKCDPQCE